MSLLMNIFIMENLNNNVETINKQPNQKTFNYAIKPPTVISGGDDDGGHGSVVVLISHPHHYGVVEEGSQPLQVQRFFIRCVAFAENI